MLRIGMLSLIFLVTFMIPRAVHAESPSEESVRKLMESSGTSDMGREILDQIIPELKQLLPQAPKTFWYEVRQKIDTEGLVKKIIPVYQRHLTAEDVKAINEFYQTDAGRNLVNAQAKIMGESYKIGEEWGQEIVEKVVIMYQQQTRIINK